MPSTEKPPARSRKRADAERNIAAILDAAQRLFGQGAVPSMSEIASVAEVGRVTLYAHFPSRDALLEAVVERALAEAEAALAELDLDAEPADIALDQAVRTSWAVLDRYRRLRHAALSELGADWLDEQHRRASGWLDQLIGRGRAAGRFRTDLPQEWLVVMFYSVLHTGADEVNAGRLPEADAPDVLAATVLSVLRTPG